MTISAFAGELSHDARYALRLMRRAPGFTAVAAATLALGIGASTAMFTVVNAVLVRPLPFPDSHELMMIRLSSGSRVSAAYVDAWRRQNHTLAGIAGWYDARVNLTGRGDPVEVHADRTTSNFFDVLSMPAFLGRTFTTAPDLDVIEAEAVLSYGFWQRRFGGDPAVVGQTVVLDGAPFTVVGVMPPAFRIKTNELAESRAEVWMPFRLTPSNPAGIGGILNVVARLDPGSTVAGAQEDFAMVAGRLEREHPSYSRNWRVEVVPLLDATVADVRLTLLVLFGGVGLLLLTACVNVANLVLGRATARQAEFAIRRSLGATTGRLIRQSLAESLVLAVFAGGLGVVLAWWGTVLSTALVPAGLALPRLQEIAIDARVLGFAGGITIFTAGCFAVVPMLAFGLREHAADAIRAATRGGSAVGAGRTRNALVIAEVALSMVVMTAAGLLGVSLWNLTRVRPGFQPADVLTLRIDLPEATYDTPDRVRTFSAELLERISSLPGVEAVGTADYLPLSNFGRARTFEIQGRSESASDARHGAWVSVVGGRYFEAMGIPLVRGRLPGPADSWRTEPVFVIDQELARREWSDQDPIGQRLIWRADSGDRFTGEIIGVVGSVRWGSLASRAPATTYWWLPQQPERSMNIVARATGSAGLLAAAVAAEVHQLDPNQPIGEVRALQDYVSDDLARPRFTALLIGAFGAAALALTAIGLYGVMALWASQRRREIGVRMALGAQRRDVIGLVMRQGMRLAIVGVGIGLLAAPGLTGFITGLLYEVTPADPATLAGVAMFLAGVAALAIYVPARRAARVNPLAALRSE